MGVDERRWASDSLASVLAAYDGFCNLKQVRQSVPKLIQYPRKKLSPFLFLHPKLSGSILSLFDGGRSKP
jgi:hypothetical protein